MIRRASILLAILAVGVLGVVAGGCGSQSTFEFDELDLSPTQDDLAEFSFGKYTIPIPLVQTFGQQEAPKRNRIEFSFHLYALVTGDYESQLDDLWKRHKGTVRDRIIRVCRNATLEELQEPELATLKSHLTDAVQSELGPKSIRRLMMTEIVTREL